MIHPVLVNDTEHYNALYLAHDGYTVGVEAELLLPFGVNPLGSLAHGIGNRLCLCLAAEGVHRYLSASEEVLFKGCANLVEMLLIFGSAAGKSVVHGGGDKLGYHLMDAVADILTVEHLTAFVIDNVTLGVHNIVVFQNGFTGLEVSALNCLLSLLDSAGKHLVVKRSVLINAEGLHHIHHSLRAEKTHYIIGHCNEEAAFAGVALTAGTATQLIIDTA